MHQYVMVPLWRLANSLADHNKADGIHMFDFSFLTDANNQVSVLHTEAEEKSHSQCALPRLNNTVSISGIIKTSLTWGSLISA